MNAYPHRSARNEGRGTSYATRPLGTMKHWRDIGQFYLVSLPFKIFATLKRVVEADPGAGVKTTDFL